MGVLYMHNFMLSIRYSSDSEISHTQMNDFTHGIVTGQENVCKFTMYNITLQNTM